MNAKSTVPAAIKGVIHTRRKKVQTTRSLEVILTYALAAYVISQSKKPVRQVLDRLFNIEVDAAKLIDVKIKPENRELAKTNLSGVLAGVFSFIQLGQPHPKINQSQIKK